MNKHLIDMRSPPVWDYGTLVGSEQIETELFTKAGLDKSQYRVSKNNFNNPEYFYRRWVVTCEDETLTILSLLGFIYVKRAR